MNLGCPYPEVTCVHICCKSPNQQFFRGVDKCNETGTFSLKKEENKCCYQWMFCCSSHAGRCAMELVGRTGCGSHRDLYGGAAPSSLQLGTFSPEMPLAGLLILGLSPLHKCLLLIPSFKERELLVPFVDQMGVRETDLG